MAKQKRNPGAERHWRDLVTEWHSSGLSMRAFCSQRQVKEASFYSGRRELQRRDAQGAAAATASFVPVRVVPTMASVEVRCPSGHVVTVANADRDTLRHLFAALVAEAPC